jgi:hypothetical protein
MREWGSVRTGCWAAPAVGICGDLGRGSGFGPAWCVGRAGQDGVAAGRGSEAGELLATQMTWSSRLRSSAMAGWRRSPGAGGCRRGEGGPFRVRRGELPGRTRWLLAAHRRGPVRVITGRHVLPCPADAAANDGEIAGGRGGSGASAYPVSPAALTEHLAACALVRQSPSVIAVLQCAQRIRRSARPLSRGECAGCACGSGRSARMRVGQSGGFLDVAPLARGRAAAAGMAMPAGGVPAWTRFGWVSRTVVPGDRGGVPVPGRGCRWPRHRGR